MNAYFTGERQIAMKIIVRGVFLCAALVAVSAGSLGAASYHQSQR